MKLQTRYTLLHILYWFANCAAYGYTAVFLQSKGMSNTKIGLVTGLNCIILIFLSPYLSSLPAKSRNLDSIRLLDLVFLFTAGIFLAISFLPLPSIVIMLAYMALLSLNVSTVPTLNMIAVNYIRRGESLNFGLSRGTGSVSYAVSAVVLGQMLEFLSPAVLSVVFAVTSLGFLITLHRLPDYQEEKDESSKSSGYFAILKKYPVLFLILLGWCFDFAAACCIGTYLINIIRSLGGSTSLYGTAIFLMAAGEMPVMAITPRLMRKFSTSSLIFFAAVCYAFRNLLVCFAPNIWIVFLGMMFQGLSYGLMTPLLVYYITRNCEKQDEIPCQTLTGIMTSGVGATIGNILGGVLQDSFGMNAMCLFAAVLTVTGLIILTLTSLYMRRVSLKERNSYAG